MTNRNLFAKATRERCMTRHVVNTNSYPCWRVCCLSFTFWLWLLQNCWQRCKSLQTRDSKIEFNLQMFESTEKGFIFSVVLRDPEFIRTFKAENINSLHHSLPLSYYKNLGQSSRWFFYLLPLCLSAFSFLQHLLQTRYCS